MTYKVGWNDSPKFVFTTRCARGTEDTEKVYYFPIGETTDRKKLSTLRVYCLNPVSELTAQILPEGPSSLSRPPSPGRDKNLISPCPLCLCGESLFQHPLYYYTVSNTCIVFFAHFSHENCRVLCIPLVL